MCKLVALCSTYDIIIIIINSYIALYPQKLYELMALYIININIHLTIKKHKYYKCMHQYQHDKKPGKLLESCD